MKLNIRRIMSGVAVIVVLLSLNMPISFCLTITSIPPPWYAGYAYLGSQGSPAAYGVMASIYTINKNVPGQNFYCQWPCVILSYAYGYWIQVGYSKDYINNYVLKFYVEKKDSSGYSRQFIGNPSAGTTYTYWISKDVSTGAWTAAVTGVFTISLGTLNPNNAVDYQAFSEMSTSSIPIDGTHFSSLQIKYTGTNWMLWDRHAPHADSPYILNQISHYAFTARGGG